MSISQIRKWIFELHEISSISIEIGVDSYVCDNGVIFLF